MKQPHNTQYDYVFLLSVLLLCSLGLLVVYSSSVHMAAYHLGDQSYYIVRQGMFAILGFSLMIVIMNIPCTYYKKIIYPLLLVNLVLMVMVLIPGVGHRAGGASRWYSFLGFSFQPSELLKITLALYIAYSMSNQGSNMARIERGLLPHLLIIGLFILLLLYQPDFGTATIIAFWLMILLFIGGLDISYILSLIAIGSLSFVNFVLSKEYRIKRIIAFLHPEKDPLGINYQINHSLYAFGTGGFWGTGIGSSKQALMFLPDAHTDFAFAILAEEMGLLGVVIVILLFGIFIWRGLKIALNAGDLYQSYLALGLVIMTGLQATINMLVVMAILPNKGLPLPFISYGGSSLIFNLISIGVLLNISKET